MRVRSIVAILGVAAALGACGGATSRVERTARPRVERSAADATALRAAQERERELRAQLGLARARIAELETALARAEARPAEVTRIGRPPITAEPETAPPVDDGPRPVLRLYGEPRPALSTSVAPLPGPMPTGALHAPPPAALRLPPGFDPEHGVPAIPPLPLPVAPAAEARVGSEPRNGSSPADDPAVIAYRAALADVAARRFEDARVKLDAFLRSHPRHPYAESALYWRGEVHYAQREYRRALADFEAVVRRRPGGSKAADALLRVGLCHRRLGDHEGARRAFDRLQREYPESVAARTASREDA